MQPTIFSDVRTDMTIAQEEIFGPVLSIIPYDTEEEAIAIANDSAYGLAGGVWAGTDEKAFEVARKIAHRPGGRSTAAPSIRWRPSVATSSRASVASAASTASRSSSR